MREVSIEIEFENGTKDLVFSVPEMSEIETTPYRVVDGKVLLGTQVNS